MSWPFWGPEDIRTILPDQTYQCRDAVAAMVYTTDQDGNVNRTQMLKYANGDLTKPLQKWILEGPLTQDELVELSTHSKVVIIWPTLTGPWEYEIRRAADRVFAGAVNYPIRNAGSEFGKDTLVWSVVED